ncbi:MAG: hypothetical protein KDE27_13540 [Planctomycetes bacterium]|nr:hypothetical protein [Planctomycetota bacterium]
MKSSLLSPLLCVLLTAALAAQDEPLRVHIIGASVSGGFRDGPAFGAEKQGDSVTLQQLLKRWAAGDARVTTHNTVQMTLLFTDPEKIGADEIGMLKRAKPDIVVALDFPFWFAYGRVGGDQKAARGERFRKGLELLGEIDAPLLVGDLPNMHGAARRMLSPAQIPAPEVLDALNAELRGWAAEHDNVHLVEFAAIANEMRTKGIALPLEDGALPTPPGAILQEDRLHPTRLGMALLGYTLQQPLAALFPADHPLHGRHWTFDEFVAAAGADGELELLMEQAEAKGKR